MPGSDQHGIVVSGPVVHTASSTSYPSSELRFVERQAPGQIDRTMRILQQRWVCQEITEGGLNGEVTLEWRDVPCVLEGAVNARG